MESNGLFSFLVSIKLLPKNGKLIALVAISSFLLSEITFAAFGFSILGVAQDMASLVSDPSSFNPYHTFLVILYAVEIAFVFVFLVVSFITTMATILVAAVSHVGNTLSIKDSSSRINGTWTKPFLTSIYASIQALGLLAIPGIFALPAFMYPNVDTVLNAVLFATVIFLFYLYLLVIWELAMVVSVVEEGSYGLVAVRKASELVEGQRLIKGYMLILWFLLLSLIVLAIYLVIFLVKGSSIEQSIRILPPT